MSLLLRIAPVISILLFASVSMATEGNVGIVLMHGKWDRPPTHVTSLAHSLEAASYKVVTPDMPWSRSRQYDVSYTQALVEIEAAAKSLRDRGATRIVVAGLSFGANGAIAYAASGRPVDAIIALSPGHTPERGDFRKALEPSVEKARKMIASGKGNERASFDDRNQGRTIKIHATAEAFFSYFDPDGIGNMQKTAAAIPVPTPIFMAVGTEDRLSSVAKASIFDHAPAHEKSLYTSVAADHNGVVEVIGPTLIAWLRSLEY